ncbi:hypothetical protein H9P43_008972 [Blastocladiella emersonii ATCC 22665]|nr:hypothetical protein H9P43_008972 [Blastocladiella emersonii ATCC 22665]
MAIPRVRATFDRLRAAFPDLHFSLTASSSLHLASVAGNSRPTTCPACALSFDRSNDAARHFQTAHAGDTLPYVCVASCSARTNRRDHFSDHLRRNPGSCALAFLCELAKSPAARDPDLMATAAALLPHQAAPDAPTAPGTALIPRLVRDIGFDTIDAALRKLEPDAVPAGLTHPLSDVIDWSRVADGPAAGSSSSDPLTVLDLVLRPPSATTAASVPAQLPMLRLVYVDEADVGKVLECAADAGIAVSVVSAVLPQSARTPSAGRAVRWSPY